MPTTDTTFAAFRRRLTRSYVLLVTVLIVAVAATTTVLALASYVGGLHDAMAQTQRRAVDAAATAAAARKPLAQAAPTIARVGRGPVRVLVFDDAHHLLSGVRQQRSASERIVDAVASSFGLAPQQVTIAGGRIVIAPDIARFAGFLFWYWSIALPVGILAIVAAWFIGRAITNRAITPLRDVTVALRSIADGDFEPAPLPGEGGEMTSLTDAYNALARRLTSASNERRENELRMRQFVADAGHELRTPLTIIMGYLDILSQGVVHDEAGIAQVHATMLDESRRMRALIERLIYLARLDRAEDASLPTFDLAEGVRRAVEQLEPVANGRLRVHAYGPVTVVGDESDVVEAVKNVVDNALKYAPDSPVNVTLVSGGSTAHVEVADRGPGMNESDVEHAFDRFYRGEARADTEGSGLGLAIAQRTFERSGGGISLRSAPGKGTTVSLTLPVAG